MKKRLETKDGRYIMTKERRAYTIVDITAKELEEVLKHAKKFKKHKKISGCFKHLNEELSFFIRLK